MNELLKPWAAMQKQLIAAHRNNVDAMFKTMGSNPVLGENFNQAAQAAKTLADQQIEAWEKWLAMWGPKD